MTRPPSRRWSRSSNRRPDRSPRGRYTAFRVTVRDPDDHLTRDNAIGRSTGYEYPHEGIDVLAARAPGLHGALLGRICGGRAGSGSRPPRSPTRPGPRPRACRRAWSSAQGAAGHRLPAAPPAHPPPPQDRRAGVSLPLRARRPQVRLYTAIARVRRAGLCFAARKRGRQDPSGWPPTRRSFAGPARGYLSGNSAAAARGRTQV
jgi:hypothetical protein